MSHLRKKDENREALRQILKMAGKVFESKYINF